VLVPFVKSKPLLKVTVLFLSVSVEEFDLYANVWFPIVFSVTTFDVVPFCPFAPYNKPQRFTIERKKGDKIISGAGGTSVTWYNYQKLINYIRELGKLDNPVNTSTIDFYKDCFITELNEKCRVNNYGLSVKERQETEENIRQRFDLMKETKSFWSHFDTVILACGPYADALRKDQQLTRDIFGDAKVISTINNRNVPQLSIAISNELLREIAKQVEIKNQHTLR